jgi:hypothetical protein
VPGKRTYADQVGYRRHELVLSRGTHGGKGNSNGVVTIGIGRAEQRNGTLAISWQGEIWARQHRKKKNY